MKFAIYGAGAIGGFLGARLRLAGQDVSLIARGPHLEAIRTKGLRVRDAVLGDLSLQAPATDDPQEIGRVDVVVLGVKAHALTAIAPRVAALLGPETVVLTVQNGLPWWYFQGLEPPLTGERLESVDPGGLIADSIDARRVIGCLAYCSAAVSEPGVIEHVEGVRFPLGEPGGSRSERVRRLAGIFDKAGLKAPVRKDLRHDIWVKMLGNAALNPISALTRTSLGEMLADPLIRELARAVMQEVVQTAAGAGVRMRISPEQRLEGAARAGSHKTSMLQDVEAGRPIEIEPIAGAVIELAGKVGVAAPNLRALYACCRLAGRAASAEPGRPIPDGAA